MHSLISSIEGGRRGLGLRTLVVLTLRGIVHGLTLLASVVLGTSIVGAGLEVGVKDGIGGAEDHDDSGSDGVVREDADDAKVLEVAIISAELEVLGVEVAVALSAGDVVEHIGITQNSSRTNLAEESDSAEDEEELGDRLGASGNAEDTRDREDKEVDGEATHLARAESKEDGNSQDKDAGNDDSEATVLARAKVEVATSGDLHGRTSGGTT